MQLVISLYVDDIQYMGAILDEILKVESQLAATFHMTNGGNTNYYLGMDVHYDQAKGMLHLNQSKYVNTIIKLYGYVDMKPAPTPMRVDANLVKETTLQASKQQIADYDARIGSLNFLSIQTRPDISLAVSILSQFMTNPNESHWKALERVFAYIKATPNRGPTYRKDAKHGGLVGYTDSDWAGDRIERRSTGGYIFLLYGAPISWKSKRQSCIALSTAEAEYIAACEAAKEAIYLKSTVNTLLPIEKSLSTITIMEDNQACIRIGQNPELHQRTKHIDIKYHYLRDQIRKGNIRLQWISTNEQLADALTKPLSKSTFDKFITEIGLTDGMPSESD
jgi:hypothetical protein